MNLLVFNLLLAIGWTILTDDISGLNLLLGFVVGFVALYLTAPLLGSSRYFDRIAGAVGLAGYFLYDLFVSSFRVAWDVLTPQSTASPAIIVMPLDARDEMEVLLTANLISLTPGTLSVDLTPEHDGLVIHAMFVEDAAVLKRDLKQGIERRVLEVFR